MNCVHGRPDGALCPHCLGAFRPDVQDTACDDCRQVSSGRCYRHSTVLVVVGEVMIAPATTSFPWMTTTVVR